MNFRNNLLLRSYRDLMVPPSPEDFAIGGSAAEGGKIVLAESDPLELLHIASILRNLGFTVITAQDSESALDLVEKHTPRMVISALELLRIDRHKLFRAMRENRDTEGIPFMLILQPGESPDFLIGHEIGAHDYIQKPVVVNEFSRRFRALLSVSAGPTAPVEPQDSKNLLVSDAGPGKEESEGESKKATAVLQGPPRKTVRDNGNRAALYRQAEAHVRESLHRVGSGKEPNIERGAVLSERMVSSVSQDNLLLLAATDRKQGFSISTHSVNVAVFGIRISQTLGSDLQTQREVALAALYHELGVVELSKNLVYRTKSPTREEMNRLRERPLYSARIFRNMGPEYSWLSQIVSQVFERENGMGHPRRLAGEELCEQARIIGIADVFDACIHKRPYREPLSGYQSLFELTTDQQRSFSDRMVKALIRSLSLYPYNECVRINTGELGRVVDINPKNLSRPIVKVLSDRQGKALPQARMVDLSEEPQLYIAEALKGSKCL